MLLKLSVNSATYLAFANSCLKIYTRTIDLINKRYSPFFERYRGYFVITQKSMFDIALLYLAKAYDVDYSGKYVDTVGIKSVMNLLKDNKDYLKDSPNLDAIGPAYSAHYKYLNEIMNGFERVL